VICVGIDWARKQHSVAIIDQQGHVLEEFSAEHTGDGFVNIGRKIQTLEPNPDRVRVAIEAHDGPLYDWLQDQQYVVVGVNPKSAAQGRALLRASGSKDDRFDAYALARLILLDDGSLPRPSRNAESREELRDLLHFRERLVQEKSDTLRRIRGLLDEWSPSLSDLCNSLHLVWQRDLLREYPLAQDLRDAHGNTLHGFATRHRLSGKTRARLFDARRQAVLPIRPGRLRVIRMKIRSMVDRLTRVIAELTQVEEEIAALMDADDGIHVVASIPGAGLVSQAALLVALSSADARGDDWRSLAAYTGMAPVTKQSGRSRTVCHRKACDHTLRRLLTYHAFRTTLTEGCWAEEDYHRRRSRGAGHQTALRAIARCWIKIARAMWRHQTLYSEEAFRQAQRPNQHKAA
jgi:hypothetical protein